MKRKIFVAVVVLISCLFLTADLVVLAGRGGRGGGGGGGGRWRRWRPAGGGGGGGRPAHKPPGGGFGSRRGWRPARCGAAAESGTRRWGEANGRRRWRQRRRRRWTKGGGPAPGAATRPSQGQLQNFPMLADRFRRSQRWIGHRRRRWCGAGMAPVRRRREPRRAQ